MNLTSQQHMACISPIVRNAANASIQILASLSSDNDGGIVGVIGSYFFLGCAFCLCQLSLMALMVPSSETGTPPANLCTQDTASIAVDMADCEALVSPRCCKYSANRPLSTGKLLPRSSADHFFQLEYTPVYFLVVALALDPSGSDLTNHCSSGSLHAATFFHVCVPCKKYVL